MSGKNPARNYAIEYVGKGLTKNDAATIAASAVAAAAAPTGDPLGDVVDTADVLGPVGDILHTETISGAHTIDLADGTVHELTLAGDATPSLAGGLTPPLVSQVTLYLYPGGHDITWPTITWENGVEPDLSTTLVVVVLTSFDAWTSVFGFFDAGASSPLNTKGDLWGFDTDDARVPVGTDGYPLVADSSAALGVSYSAIGVVAAYPFHAEVLCDSAGPILQSNGDVITVTGVPN